MIKACAVTSDNDTFTFPCGICRQFMREFGLNTVLIMVTPAGKQVVKTLEDMLPHSFGPDDLVK